MSSSKIIYLLRDFAAGVYQSLQIADTDSHVGIFDLSCIQVYSV